MSTKTVAQPPAKEKPKRATTQAPPKKDPAPVARLSKESVDHLFDVWCALDGISEVMGEDSDETMTGLAGALRIMSRELGRIHSEAAESLRHAAAPAE
jgi:hypothetical protein